jgi:phosphomannomutase
MIWYFSPSDASVKQVSFEEDRLSVSDENGSEIPAADNRFREMNGIRSRLGNVFPAELRFPGIVRVNYVDGIRITFSNGDVAHIRPSGNADELRIYAVADTQARADEIGRIGIAEPDGILRRMEKAAICDEGQ